MKSNKSQFIQNLRTLVLIIIGIVFIARPSLVISMLPIILGIVVLLDALSKVMRILTIWKQKHQQWWMLLIADAVLIVLGVVFILNPFNSYLWLIRFLGITLAFGGALEIWIGISDKKDTAKTAAED